MQGPPDSREEEAKREIAATVIPRPVARAVAACFLAMVFGVALAEMVRGLRAGGTTPWGDFARATVAALGQAAGGDVRGANRTALAGIEAFEDRLDEESFVAGVTLSGTQWLLTAVLGTGNEQVLVGRDGWLFFRPGVDALVGPGFLEPRRLAARAAGGDAWHPAPRPDPRPALLAFQRDLAARGIALVVVPAPSKATVHPERLASGAAVPPGGLQNPSYAPLFRELQAAGMRVVDPAPLLAGAGPPDGGAWYLKTDSHWTPAAVDKVAQALAGYLVEEGLVAAPSERAFRRQRAEVVGSGDLRALLRLPASSRLFPPERVAVERVTTADGRPWEPQPGAEVLLLGDSFTNVFSQPGLGWGEGAGLAEQLAFHLGRPVDRIARNAGGAYASREALARAISRGEDRLAGTKVVVYELAARELAIGDWRVVDLPTAGGTPEVPGPGIDPARLAEGFAVWESNRTGDWRLWTSRLDGSDLRQLSADEPGRQHCCAHLSPDGRAVVYLSRAGAKEAYPEVEIAGDLRLLKVDGSAERTLARARTYGWGNRAAVWREGREGRELVYVGEDGRTLLLDLGTGRSRPLTREPRAELGWLVDPTLAFATNAAPSFSLYDAAGTRVLERQPLAGCEPYFTPDGRWGFWIAGAGGPLQRMRLADRETSTLIRRDDPRLPEGRRYLYFPMVSRDGRFMAWGASDGDHHHFRADYDVFVAPLDPLRVELAGEPIRITDHPATDRYPDVHPPPLALGWHAGEAPLTVRLPAPGPDVRWDWGDGAVERGGPGVHVYEEPGAYAVEARVGGRVLHGEVLVAEAAPPRAVGAALTEDGSRVVVRFDEEVELDDASVRFASGRGIRSRRPGEDGRSLLVEPDGEVAAGEAIELDGVADRAEPPNRMPPTRLAVEAPPWPSERGGILVLWQTATDENLVYDPEEGALIAEGVEARGPARLDRHGAMVLGRGSFEASDRAAARLFEALRKSRAVSIEAVVTPAAPATPGFVPILSFGDGPADRNLALGQQGGHLALSLLTGPAGASAGPVTVPLVPLPPGRATHVAVTYSRGELRAYRGGEPVPVPQSIGGGFARWRPGRLTFGSEVGRGPAWAGTLEGVALYDRVLPPAEVAENAERSQHARSLRPEPPGRLEVRARLRACSRTPTLREITPYRQALAVCEWEVERELTGKAPGRRLRVAHWVLLDGERQPITSLRPGAPARLRIEPFVANPQLEGVVLSDTLTADRGAVLLYAVEMDGGE